MNFSLLAEASFFETYWLVFVLLGLIIVLYVVSFVRKKKYNEQSQNMLNTLKPGAKVKTYSGFYGTIVSVKETTDGKVLLLEMGEGTKVSYTTIDANAVYGMDSKEDVVYDKEGNIIVKEDKKAKNISSDKAKAIKEFEKLEDSKTEVKEDKTVLGKKSETKSKNKQADKNAKAEIKPVAETKTEVKPSVDAKPEVKPATEIKAETPKKVKKVKK